MQLDELISKEVFSKHYAVVEFDFTNSPSVVSRYSNIRFPKENGRGIMKYIGAVLAPTILEALQQHVKLEDEKRKYSLKGPLKDDEEIQRKVVISPKLPVTGLHDDPYVITITDTVVKKKRSGWW